MSERSIFLAALDISVPAQRAAYLDQACGADVALRRQIEDLIAAEARLGGFLMQPHPDVEATADQSPHVAERPGTQIGPYKLLQQIGEGGMGVVYMAEQEQPVRRRVALKIIKPGMDSRQVIARFEAERQALAMMDHQNIARVLDAGTTQSGRPYFVMELVHGVPITKFCDDSRLTPRERLELFVPVCQAIQHAHQKGVIHRDIKPSNILVTMYDDKPVPKVIDFGVAKAVEQRLTEKTLFTQYGTLVGTFEYMSPEQAEMNAFGVDTRSDIYSLGVLLYELLTGTTPLERPKLREAALVELVRLIKEEEPPRPSIRLSSTSTLPKFAAACRTEPARLSQLLRGELDWIVMKCLEKDRTRRYETANALTRDVERYLKDEQVEACPPSAAYRLRKFFRKHRAGVLTAAMVAMTMLLGTLASYWQAYRAARAEQRAVIEAQLARQAKEAEVSERQRAEANAKSARENELVAKQQRDAATEAQKLAIQEKNNALAAREELRHTLYAAEMNLVQGAWENRQYRRVKQLLDEQPTDLRGFEWRYWRRRLQHGRLSEVAIPLFSSRAFGRAETPKFARSGTRLAAVLDPAIRSSEESFGLLAVFDCATGQPLFPPLDPFPGRTDSHIENRRLVLSDDGSILAVTVDASSPYKTGEKHLQIVSIRDGNTGREIRSLKNPGFIYNVAFTPAGDLLAVSYVEERGTIDSRKMWLKVWDVATGEERQTLSIPAGNYGALLWNPGGTRLVLDSRHVKSAANDPGDRNVEQRIEVVDVASGESLWQRDVPAERTGRPQPWTWSPDGKCLVISLPRAQSTIPALQLWDSDTGATLATLDREEASLIRESRIAFTPDSKRLAVATLSNEIYLWDLPELPFGANAAPLQLESPALTLHASDQAIAAIAFSADGRQLHTASEGSLVTWDVTARDTNYRGPGSSTEAITSIFSPETSISADGSKVALNANRNGRGGFLIWDLVRDEELCWLNAVGGPYKRAPIFCPQGEFMLYAKERRTTDEPWEFVVHDAHTGAALRSILVEPTRGITFIPSFFFHPDGKQVATLVRTDRGADFQNPAHLLAWDVTSGQSTLSVRLESDERSIPDLVGYSSDGASFVVRMVDGAIFDRSRRVSPIENPLVFYDVRTGQRQRSFTLRTGMISLPRLIGPHSVLAYHPKSTPFLGPFDTIYGDSDLVVVDLLSGRERQFVRGHGGFDRYAMSPDGARLALYREAIAYDGEGEFSVWSLVSGKRLLTWRRRGRCGEISFTNEGNRLVAVCDSDRTGTVKPIQIWDATLLPEEAAR